MKTKNKAVLMAVFTIVGILSSCSDDFLDRPPIDTVVDANYYQDDDQVLAGGAGLYSAAWKAYCDQANWKLGDVRAGLVFSPWATSVDVRDFTTYNITGLSANNVNAYQGFFVVIGQANTIEHNIETFGGAEVSDEIKNHVIAECRFMRATAYTHLVLNYGPVPIIVDNISLLNSSAVKRNTVESVWEFIKRDYLFAVDNLMEESPDLGRINKWSAEGMLARTYLTIAGISGTVDPVMLDSAQYYSDRVINMSGKRLLDSYADLFTYPYDNNDESLFELQWVYSSQGTDAYGYINSMVSQITPSNSLAANGDGWGGGLSATSWILSLYDGLYVGYDGEKTTAAGYTNDSRLKSTFMLPGFKYPEFDIPADDDSFIDPDDNSVIYKPEQVTDEDPRNGNAYNFSWIKKYVIGNIPGETLKQTYPNNTYELRLAEMYLIYAEAQVLKDGGTTTDVTARNYFKVVNDRAFNRLETDETTFTSLTWNDIFEERAKEFAMEGKAWNDLARRHYYSPNDVYAILNSQDRDQFLAYPEPEDNPIGWSFYKTTWVTEAGVNVSDANFLMPFPQVELNQAPSLSEEPVDYEFLD